MLTIVTQCISHLFLSKPRRQMSHCFGMFSGWLVKIKRLDDCTENTTGAVVAILYICYE